MLPVRVSKVIGKRSKYGAIRTVVNGITFASKLEAKRYSELRALEATGGITNLELQPVYKLTINGFDCGKFIGDFRYFKRPNNTERGEYIVEDCKGFRTPVYRLKKKITEALYPGVVIVEITR